MRWLPRARRHLRGLLQGQRERPHLVHPGRAREAQRRQAHHLGRLHRRDGQGTGRQHRAGSQGGKDAWPLTQWADPIILGVAGPEKFTALQRGRSGGTTRRSWRHSRRTPTWPSATSRTTCSRPASSTHVRPSRGRRAVPEPGRVRQPDHLTECDESLKPGKDFTFFKMPRPRRVRARRPGRQRRPVLRRATPTTRPQPERCWSTPRLGCGAVDLGRAWWIHRLNAEVSRDTYPTDLTARSPTCGRATQRRRWLFLDDWIGVARSRAPTPRRSSNWSVTTT